MSCGIEIETLLDAHATWLRSEMSVREIDGGWAEITTPYLDRHNDHIQIFMRRKSGGNFVLTDNGHAAHDLGTSGHGSPQRRRELLTQILNGLGAHLGDGDRLESIAGEGDFALRMHGLVQAMLAADALARGSA